MRIALIDYSLHQRGDVLTEMEEKGVEVYEAESISDFQALYGDVADYDCALLHPGVTYLKSWKSIFVQKYPHVPFGFISDVPDDYFEDEIPLFAYASIDAIIDYFSKLISCQQTSE